MEKTQQERFYALIKEMGIPIEQNEKISNEMYTAYNTLGYVIIFDENGSTEGYIKLK